MSVALFDLGQRLRSASTAQPVARASFAPVLPPVEPVAVMLRGSGDGVLVSASGEDGVVHTGHGQDALSALAAVGVKLGSEPRTLVVPGRATLNELLELARAARRDSPYAEQAAVVGWWAQRADHPGSGAVLVVTDACAARWVLGVPPAHEQQLGVWRQWLGVTDTGPRGLLRLAAMVSAGQPLPGLEAFGEDDRRSWEYFVGRIGDPKTGWDWRARDNRREAALGLATRCDAAELYQSLSLADPFVAVRESFSATVVTGVVSALPAKGSIVLTLDRLLCRLRQDTEVEGYPTLPRAARTGLKQERGMRLRGRIAATQVTGDERLVVTIEEVVVRQGAVRLGQRLTLRPRSIDPQQQRSARQELHRRYAARHSWLAGGPAPTPRRRDVPLDVVIAAADADPATGA